MVEIHFAIGHRTLCGKNEKSSSNVRNVTCPACLRDLKIDLASRAKKELSKAGFGVK
jgi:hypothetical protein